MPILVDFSSLLITKCTGFPSDFAKGQSTKKMGQIARHTFLDSMFSLKDNWGSKCGEIVICADDKNYWRKNIFPNYKGTRVEKKEESDIDWSSIKEIREELELELREIFPWKVIRAPLAEADDVIAVLVKYLSENELVETGLFESPQKCLSISSDHDGLQLYKFKNYAQWCPRKKTVLPKPQKTFLFEKIIRGDSGDGICNILSHPDSLMNKVRQKSCTEVFVNMTLEDPKSISPEAMKRLIENRTLIDFDCIPKDISRNIISEYVSSVPTKNTDKIINYCAEKRLKQIMERVVKF